MLTAGAVRTICVNYFIQHKWFSKLLAITSTRRYHKSNCQRSNAGWLSLVIVGQLVTSKTKFHRGGLQIALSITKKL